MSGGQPKSAMSVLSDRLRASSLPWELSQSCRSRLTPHSFLLNPRHNAAESDWLLLGPIILPT